MTKWFKCDERMPDRDDYERKLVYSKCDGICTAQYHDTYWDLDPKGDYATGGYIDEVTHWAECPKTPDEIKKEREEYENSDYCKALTKYVAFRFQCLEKSHLKIDKE